MLYVPSQPIQHAKENPENYRNPAERGLQYKDVEIKTSDGLLLKGWFITQENPRSFATFVYLHENAGNIGLRMDYFQKMHSLGYNLLVVAYRGYSES